MIKISDCSPWSDESDLKGNFLLCSDKCSGTGGGSGEFVFLQFVILLLKLEIPVTILSFNHNFNHFEVILRKQNLDVKKLEQSGVLRLIQVTFDDVSSDIISWSRLKSWLIDEEYKNRAVLIDDLDMMEIIATTKLDSRLFMCKLLTALTQNNDEKMSAAQCVIAYGRHPVECYPSFPSLSKVNGEAGVNSESEHLNASDTYDSNGEPLLLEYLRYRADLTIVVVPLSSGYSSAVHGLIYVQSERNTSKTYQFRALDSGVFCLPIGN